MSQPEPLPERQPDTPRQRPASELGTRFLAEIREQPEALRRVVANGPVIATVAEEARRRGVSIVRMVGHGSSDNAASYGVYAFGLLPRLTALRDSITLTVHYRTELDMTGSMVLGLSQSGRTPDVVEYVTRARELGAFTVAVTNEPASELATVADATVPLGAGPELAVAATKTYLNQLGALVLLAAHLAGEGPRLADALHRTADVLDSLVGELEVALPSLVVPFSYVGRMFVVGRGPEFATAREIALKLLETCRVAAEPLTATDLAHGPVAALDALFPVWAIASPDATLPALEEAVGRARDAGALIVASGSAAASLGRSEYVLPVPEAPLSLLGPLLSVVPGQLFAWALSRAKGLDADSPRGLAKVTLAR